EGHRHQERGRGRLRPPSGRTRRARPVCGQSPAPAGAFPAGVRMSERIYSRIAGTGSYLPEKVVTNDDLAKVVDTSDEWIRTRTGIRERRVAAEGQTTSDMAYQAALKAIEAAGIAAEEIDLIVVGTTTPDVIFPSTACLVQQKLGIAGCPAFDVN